MPSGGDYRGNENARALFWICFLIELDLRFFCLVLFWERLFILRLGELGRVLDIF